MSLPNHSSTPRLLVAATFTCIVLFQTGASAGLIAYDPFNQAPTATMSGTVSIGGSPTAVWPLDGQLWNTPTSTNQIIAGNLSGSVITQGNHAQIGSAAASASIFRLFGVTVGGAGSDLWLSFLINAQSGKNSQVLSFFNGATEQLAIGVNAATVFGMSVRTGGATTDTGNPPVSTTIAPNNLDHFVAVHLQLVAGAGNSTFTFFLDPDVSSFGGLAPSGGQSGFYTGGGSQPFSFDRIRLGEFSSGTTSFDEIRLGSTWGDVSPVPEPSSIGMLGVGLAGLAGRRRRRR